MGLRSPLGRQPPNGLSTHPEEYERRVVGVFDQALLGERPGGTF